MHHLVASRRFLVLVLCLIVFFSWSCFKGTGDIVLNESPKTRLANVPPEDFVSNNPRLTLFWVGDDPDGYVIAFRYTWTFRSNAGSPFEAKPYSTILNIGIDKSGGEKFALMTDADSLGVPQVYKYFATLPPEGIAPDSANKIDAGESLTFAFDVNNQRRIYHVWASNPSSVRFPVHVNPNSGTFIFDSQDSLNPHTFEIAAIDNNGMVDANPARLSFSTPNVTPPHAEILGSHNDTVLVRLDRTDTFRGLLFEFRGFDPNSRTIDYSWAVDKDVWTSVPGRIVPWSEFSQNTIAQVTASSFPPESLFSIKHRLYLRARNEFGSIDTLGYYIRQGQDSTGAAVPETVYARTDFYTFFPLFLRPGYEQRTLLLNGSWNYEDSTNIKYPNRDTLDNYYRSIYDAIGRGGKYDFAHATHDPLYFPGLGILGKYSTVFWYADVARQLSGGVEVGDGKDIITAYVNIGGKVVITAYSLSTEYIESFMQYVPHCQDNRLRIPYSFIGARGEKGYPDVSLDYSKIDTAWHNRAPNYYPDLGLHLMRAGRPSGFGEIIYNWRDNGLGGGFTGTVGVRYIGLTYRVIYFGFPLYYCERPTVIQMLTKAFQDIGY